MTDSDEYTFKLDVTIDLKCGEYAVDGPDGIGEGKTLREALSAYVDDLEYFLEYGNDLYPCGAIHTIRRIEQILNIKGEK